MAQDAATKGFASTIILSTDTDVLVLLLHFIDRLSRQVWMKSSKGYVPVHEIRLDEAVRKNILAYHALTGCDTTIVILWPWEENYMEGVCKRSTPVI